MKNFNSYFRLHNILLLMLFFMATATLTAQQPEHVKDPESLIRHLYDQVTFPPGESPDWDVVRKLFIPNATVVMRIGKHETTTLTLDGWILDFVNFIYKSNVSAVGFEEKIIKMETMIFGDIAHVLVLYTAYLPGRTKTPQEGVDSFHMIKKDGRWFIVSILNEIPGPERPKPSVLNN